MKISGIYKITNTVTGDFYIGSSKNVKQRWMQHKKPSTWKRCSNNPMYIDMQEYGIDKFELQILEEVEIDKLKEKEQHLIEKLKPTYNRYNANGRNIDKQKKANRKYQKSEKRKNYQKKYYSQLCCYNGKTLTLDALSTRFQRAGIAHPVLEAKKYLLNK